MRKIVVLVCATLFLTAPAAFAAPATTPAATPAAHYSTSTTQMSVLLGDPAAKAVLQKYIPQLVANNDMAERAAGMTLREVADAVKAYAPDLLNEKLLGQIDADLALVPVKN